MLIFSAASAARRDGGPDCETDEILEADELDCQTDEISWAHDTTPDTLLDGFGATHNTCEGDTISTNYHNGSRDGSDDLGINYNPERDPG